MANTTGERNGSETVGRRLASLRALRGLSQAEAAERAGITQPYLSLLESDSAPGARMTTIARLADVYGASLDYIVRGAAA